MSCGACFFAVVTTDTEIRVDDEHVIRIGDTFFEKKIEQHADLCVLAVADICQAPFLGRSKNPFARLRVLPDQIKKVGLSDHERFAGHDGGDRCISRLRRFAEERHFADIVSGREIRLCNILAAKILAGDLHGAFADHKQIVAGVPLAKENLVLFEVFRRSPFGKRDVK